MQAQRTRETGGGRQQLNWLRDIGIVARHVITPRELQKTMDRRDGCTPPGRSGARPMGWLARVETLFSAPPVSVLEPVGVGDV